MKLTDEEKYQYLNTHILPTAQYLVNTEEYFTIFDFEGKTVATSKTSANVIGLTPELLIGKTYNNILNLIPKNILNEIIEIYNIDYENLHNSLKKIHQIIMTCIQEKRIVNYLEITPDLYNFKIFNVTLMPIIHPNNEVIGVYFIPKLFTLFGLQEFIQLNQNTQHINKTFTISASDDKNLTKRQQEILFLITNGLSEDYTAKILGITRSTVNTIIRNQIMPKFNLDGHKIYLIDMAVKLGYHLKFPTSLLKYHVIILDEDIEQKVNLLMKNTNRSDWYL